jgi:hypothetical protein
MLATEYHLDRRLRSAQRGAEISTAGIRTGGSSRIGPESEQSDAPNGDIEAKAGTDTVVEPDAHPSKEGDGETVACK